MAEGVKMFQKLIAVSKLSHREKIKRTPAVVNTPSDFFFFNVLLTVHLSIILVINQLNAQILIL